MELALLTLEIAAPVFLLGFAGWVWVRVGADFRVDFITRLSFFIGVPALLFTALARAEFAPEDFAALVGATFAAYAGTGALIWAGLRLAGLPARVWLLALVNGNTGNVGVPVALFAFGEQGLAVAVTIFAIQALIGFTFGVWLVSGESSPRQALRQPIFYGAAAGLIVALADWTPPVFAMRTLDLAGQVAIPLMLMTLGVSIARLEAPRIGRAAVMSLARLVPCAAAAYAAGLAFGLDGTAARVLMLQMTMPAAVTSYLIAERYGAAPREIAGLVVVSTVLAVGYLPAVLALLVAVPI